jgi:hypothetical protein
MFLFFRLCISALCIRNFLVLRKYFYKLNNNLTLSVQSLNDVNCTMALFFLRINAGSAYIVFYFFVFYLLSAVLSAGY